MALAQDLFPLAVPHPELRLSSRGCHTGFCGQGFALLEGGPLSLSCCGWAGVNCGKHVPPACQLSRRKTNLEKIWREFFSDPSQWWDHRLEKANSRYPDFKHKKTRQSLWLDNNFTPSWVETELAAMAPGILQSNIFSWNLRLRRYTKVGDFRETMDLFQQMQRECIILDKFTYVTVLNACSGLLALEEGKRIHLQIIKSGFECDVFVSNCLVDMYAKCGKIVDARKVFDKMPMRSTVSWTTLILGYVRCGQGQEAMELFRLMQQERVDLSPVSFVAVLNACASILALDEGRDAHEQIIARGYESNTYVANALVDMYTKCGSIEDARRVFEKIPIRDVVSWTVLIIGYVKCGRGYEALEVYRLMQQDGVDLSPVTFVGVLNACGSIGSLEEGRRAHEQIIEKGYECDLYVANSLVDMYAKCGSMKDAQIVFNQLQTRSLVSWNALILGYVKCGKGQKALELYEQMQREGMDFDPVTFVGVLNACASIGALEEGRRAHEQVIDKECESNAYVANSLVDMYIKCGSMEDARNVFIRMPEKDVVSGNAMLAGYCKYGYAKEAIEHFEQMCQEEQVDGVSFTSLLSACSHGGLVDEGMHYFESMSALSSISPGVEHYACVIDLLGRAGHLDEAEDLIRVMPDEPNTAVWMSLLGACRTHGNVKMAERIAKQILFLEPGNAASYIQLSNIYAAASKWDRVQAVREGWYGM